MCTNSSQIKVESSTKLQSKYEGLFSMKWNWDESHKQGKNGNALEYIINQKKGQHYKPPFLCTSYKQNQHLVLEFSNIKVTSYLQIVMFNPVNYTENSH